MLPFFYFILAGMILLCTAGTALGLGLVINRPWVSLAVGPWVLTTVFFALESIVPLGNHGILLGVGLSAISGWLFLEAAGQSRLLDRYLAGDRLSLWRESYTLASGQPSNGWIPGFQLKPFGGILLVLLGTFAYAALWRYPFPHIDADSEKLPDLMYITSYLAGDGVPARDFWCAPYTSVQYYSFQHYAAALMGRAFDLAPGVTYNYAFCLLVALTTTTGFAAIATFSQKIRVRVICCASLLVGGFGVSGIIHLLLKHVDLWTNMRFIGNAKCDVEPLGTWLAQYSSSYPSMDLPAEPLSYSIYLGDYHAPLSGLYLLFLALLVLGQDHFFPARDKALLAGIAAATLPWCLVANTWSFPLQVLLLGSWSVHRLISRKFGRTEMVALLAGGGGVFAALLGYLSRFVSTVGGSNTALKLVAMKDHTPPVLFLLFLFPIIAIIALSIFCRQEQVAWIALFWLGILTFSEFVYIKDIYSGLYERFNSTLKWWPWLDAGVICSLAPMALNYGKARWLSVLLCFAIGYPCLFALDLGYYWWTCPKIANGVLTGDSFILADPAASVLYSHLKVLPTGLTVERPEGAAFTNTTQLSLMSGKPCWLGWLGHEQLWRNYDPELTQRYDKLNALYAGNSSDVEWLAANHIQYILWFKPQDSEALRVKLDSLLARHYRWVETLRVNDCGSGYWVLTDPT